MGYGYDTDMIRSHLSDHCLAVSDRTFLLHVPGYQTNGNTRPSHKRLRSRRFLSQLCLSFVLILRRNPTQQPLVVLPPLMRGWALLLTTALNHPRRGDMPQNQLPPCIVVWGRRHPSRPPMLDLAHRLPLGHLHVP